MLEMVTVVEAEKKVSDTQIRSEAGKLWKDSSGCTIYRSDVDVVTSSGKFLARFRKGVIDTELCQLGLEQYLSVGFKQSNNRGNASGRYERGDGGDGGDTLVKQFRKFKLDGGSIFETDKVNVNSGIMGYMDSPNWRHPCRKTAFTKDYFEKYQAGLPFIERIDTLYKELRPDEHSLQRKESLRSNYHIANTSFSTITVNANFQTGLHKDSGDFTKGFGNLVVLEKGTYKGGYTLFPQYGVGFDCRMGDFLAMDVHQWHCNTPLIGCDTKDNIRLSFVCYLRNRMHQCPMLDEILPSQEGMSTQDKIDKIVSTCGSDNRDTCSVTKTDLGKGKFGHNWYLVKGDKYQVKYYNKQYTITNLLTGERDYSLTIGYHRFSKGEF